MREPAQKYPQTRREIALVIGCGGDRSIQISRGEVSERLAIFVSYMALGINVAEKQVVQRKAAVGRAFGIGDRGVKGGHALGELVGRGFFLVGEGRSGRGKNEKSRRDEEEDHRHVKNVKVMGESDE
jgi:hypothetical protein